MAGRNPQAIAKALIRAQTPATGMQPGYGGFGGPPGVTGTSPSPLVASYGDWAGGTGLARGLPRPWDVFQSGTFGPLSPMLPMPIDTPADGDDQAPPRRWIYPVSWNVPHGEPGSEGTKLASFATLRSIGQTYSVARACIQLRKTELLGLGWDVVPTKQAEKAMRGSVSARKEFEARRAKVRKFWRRPDSDYFTFRDWFTVLLEDVLVIDALSIYLWPSKRRKGGVLGSDLGELAAIDGSTIRPLVDIHGGRPKPPNVALQQYGYGVPRVDLMTLLADEDIKDMGDALVKQYRGDQFIYRPQHVVDWQPYGFAPIEQALVPIISGLQRQQYQLDFFGSGSVPALFVTNGVTDSTPQQNRELQDALNAMAGDQSWKHKIIVLPGGSQTMPQNPADLAGPFDELVMTQTCMAFSVMPMELGITPRASTSGHSAGAHNQMGKMSSDVQERKANRPMLEWFGDIFNHIIQHVLGQEDMKWWWEGLEEDEDEQAKTDMQIRKIATGLMSVDEARVENGQDAWGLPLTSEPVLVTPTGVIPFGSIDPLTGQPKGLTDKLTAAPPPLGAQPPAQPPQGGTGGQPAKKPPKPPKDTGGGGAKPAQQTAGTPAHAGAQQHVATTTAVSTAPTKAQPKPAAPTQAATKSVDTFAALRELDLIRRRLVKGRGIDHWAPEHVPAEVFADLRKSVAAEGHEAAVAKARDAVRDLGGRERRDSVLDTISNGVVGSLKFLAGQLGSGVISTAAFTDRAVDALRRGIRAGLQMGWDVSREHGMTTKGAGVPDSRLQLYAGTVVQAYGQGHALATLGHADDPDNIAVRWHARPGACELCSARNGQLFTVGTLPGFPGDGGFGERATVCLGGPNCRCGLGYETVDPDDLGGPVRDHPTPSPVLADAVARAQDQLAGDVQSVRQALVSDDPTAVGAVLDGIANRQAHAQRPYIDGLLADIYTGLSHAGAPVPVGFQRPTGRDEDSGWLSGAVITAIVAAAVAAAIAHQAQSQQEAVPATAGKLSKAQVNYRLATISGRSCGTCSMYTHHSCTLVAGDVDPGDVCDRWEPAGVTKGRKDGRPRAAGVAVRADDTGRVLMLQRAFDENDDAGGRWEFPGGRLEDGESPLDAARREWAEETGCTLPDGNIVGQWIGRNGKYQGFVLAVPHEADVPIFTGRDQVDNPDNPDPDGDPIEAIAWFDPDHLRDNPAVREELRDDIGTVLDAIEKSLAPGLSKLAHAVALKVDEGAVGDYRARHLIRWYNEGGGGVHRWVWGAPEDLTACHRVASEHMSSDEAWRFCNTRHHQVLGTWNSPKD